jgi:hypothetical protein
MPNPFRSEADAYRFVWLTIAYFAAIVVAAAIDTLLGVAVFALLTLAATSWLLKRRRETPVRQAPARRGAEDERRILVIANETVAGHALTDVIRGRAEGVREEVLVVCPALNSPLRHWASDEDAARAEAQRRLERSLRALRAFGVNARGEIGDADPLQAIEDALRTFGPEELIISTHPEGRSKWLERGVVEGARARFEMPITHVVVDLESEREEIRQPSDG